MSHSKRNTSLAFFTSYERAQLRTSWGSQSAQLTRDSFLPLGSCALCLLPAVDPVACNGGPAPSSNRSNSSDTVENKEARPQPRRNVCHVFCRTCVVSNLLAQRTEAKRLEREDAARRSEAAEVEALEDEEARKRAVEDFDRVQAGLDSQPGPAGKAHGVRRRDDGSYWKEQKQRFAEPAAQIAAGDGAKASNTPAGAITDGSAADKDGATKKRKFDLNEDEVHRISEADNKKARQALSDERRAAAEASALPSFWVPSQIPADYRSLSGTDASADNAAKGNDGKIRTLCPGSTLGTEHFMSLKSIVPVHFKEEPSVNGDSQRPGTSRPDGRHAPTRICPACSRTLSNASRAVLAKPCGHVLCGHCVRQFLSQPGFEDASEDIIDESVPRKVRCFECSEDITERRKKGSDGKEKDKVRPGLVDISSEGTGFAGGGQNVVKKEGVAFQC